MSSAKVYQIKPNDFIAKVHVSALYLEFKKQFLLLKLSEKKEEAGAWGVPAGKVDINETPIQAAYRELFEETGIQLSQHLHFVSELYIRKPTINYSYHMFTCLLDNEPAVRLSEEHNEYRWASFQEAKKLPLMKAGWEALEIFYSHKR